MYIVYIQTVASVDECYITEKTRESTTACAFGIFVSFFPLVYIDSKRA